MEPDPGHTYHHDDDHDHDHDHEHEHEHAHHGEEHHHAHQAGLSGFFASLFRPHSHDAADSIDDALVGTREGIRAVQLSFLGLGVTAILQLAVVLLSGSVALLADTI